VTFIMSYYLQTKYDANFFSEGIGRYTTKWVESPLGLDHVKNESADLEPEQFPAIICDKFKPRTRARARARARARTHEQDQDQDQDQEKMPLKKRHDELLELKKLMNLECDDDQIESTVTALMTIRKGNRGVPWTCETLLEALRKTNSDIYTADVKKEIADLGLFPLWSLTDTEKSVFLEHVEKRLYSGENVISLIFEYGTKYIHGLMLENFMLDLFEVLELPERIGKTTQAEVAEWKMIKDIRQNPSLLDLNYYIRNLFDSNVQEPAMIKLIMYIDSQKTPFGLNWDQWRRLRQIYRDIEQNSNFSKYASLFVKGHLLDDHNFLSNEVEFKAFKILSDYVPVNNNETSLSRFQKWCNARIRA
jgi:hypothetical protein